MHVKRFRKFLCSQTTIRHIMVTPHHHRHQESPALGTNTTVTVTRLPFSCTPSHSLRVSINTQRWTMRKTFEVVTHRANQGSRKWHLHKWFARVPVYVARTTHIHLLPGYERCSTASGMLAHCSGFYTDGHANWIWLCTWKARRFTVAVVLIRRGGISWCWCGVTIICRIVVWL
jgi:hypothetical protein